MKKADLVTGVILLILSGYVIEESLRMPPAVSFELGMGSLPLWLGLTLAVLAVILIVSAWRRPRDPKDRSPFPAKNALISVTLVLAGLAGYIFLMEWLGFIADTFLLVVFLLKGVEREQWPMTLMVAALTTGALYIVFEALLTIGLPKNMFGF
jgi:hypothetical protein